MLNFNSFSNFGKKCVKMRAYGTKKIGSQFFSLSENDFFFQVLARSLNFGPYNLGPRAGPARPVHEMKKPGPTRKQKFRPVPTLSFLFLFCFRSGKVPGLCFFYRPSPFSSIFPESPAPGTFSEKGGKFKFKFNLKFNLNSNFSHIYIYLFKNGVFVTDKY